MKVKVTNNHPAGCGIIINGTHIPHGGFAFTSSENISKLFIDKGIVITEESDCLDPSEYTADAEADTEADTEEEPSDLTEDEKIEKIKEIIQTLDEDDFTSTGKPRVDILEEKLGFDVTAEMRDEAMA